MKTKTAPQISPVMQEVSAYIAAAPKKTLPKEVAEKTKHHVLDTDRGDGVGFAPAARQESDFVHQDARRRKGSDRDRQPVRDDGDQRRARQRHAGPRR
jgi:hypothetical protein